MNPSAPPERLEKVSVLIGQWGVAAAPVAIRTLLGSCVGVVLYDRVARVGGVAHIVLPNSGGATAQPGRFADTAIPGLISDIDRALGRPSRGRLTAKFAGGANMFQSGAALNIGQKNCEAVERILTELGVRIEAKDVGGETGRHLTLDTRSGIVAIRVPGGADYSI